MNRNQLLTILKINGLTKDAPKDDVRNVLKSANYNEIEIQAAFNILSDNQTLKTARIDGLHTVFYSDTNLRPNEVSSLLGVDIEIKSPISPRSRKNGLSFFDIILIVGLSLIFALLGILSYMYLENVGYFHPLN